MPIIPPTKDMEIVAVYTLVYLELMIVFTICTSLALVAGQHYLFGRFPSRPIDYNSIDAPLGSQVNARDPRQNRGPVVFPPSPPDAIDESSGVIVGASGYGFVPPQQNTDTETETTDTSTNTNTNSENTSITSNSIQSNTLTQPGTESSETVTPQSPPFQSRVGPSYFTTTALRSPSPTSYAAFNYYNYPHFQHLRFV